MAMTWTLWCRFGLVAQFGWSELKVIQSESPLQVLENIRQDHEDGLLTKPVFLHIKTAALGWLCLFVQVCFQL